MMCLGMYYIFLGEDGLSIMSQLIKNICETGEWPKVFTKVTMIPLKKPSATKCNEHRIIGSNTLSERIVAWILRRRCKRKIEDVFGEDHFQYRRGKGTREGIGMLEIITVGTLDIDE